MPSDLFRILLSADPNDPRNGGGAPDAGQSDEGSSGDEGTDGTEGTDGGDESVGDESGGTAIQNASGAGEGEDEGAAGAEGAKAKEAAAAPFAMSERDLKLIGNRLPESTINAWKATPEGQKHLREVIDAARDELVEKTLNGKADDKAEGDGSPIDYDGELAKMIPDFAPDEETEEELAELLGKKGYPALKGALGANKQVRSLIGNLAKHQDRLAGQVGQHLFDTQLSLLVEQIAPDMDDTQFDALRAKVASAAKGVKNLTPRTLIKLAKQAREELNAPNANRKAREDLEKTMNKRSQHNGGVPDKNAKAPNAKPAAPIDKMKAAGRKFVAEQKAKAIAKK